MIHQQVGQGKIRTSHPRGMSQSLELSETLSASDLENLTVQRKEFYDSIVKYGIFI